MLSLFIISVIFKKKPPNRKESFKYFIGYNDNDVIRPLFLGLPQMIEYLKCFNNNSSNNDNDNNNNNNDNSNNNSNNSTNNY